jgi:hypothetical protein
MATKNGFDAVFVMRVTPIGPADPADGAAEPAGDPSAAGAEDSLEAAGVVQATATSATPAVRTSPRIQPARFLDSIMRVLLKWLAT